MVLTMILAKKVREKLKLTPTQMQKLLNRPTIQNYVRFEQLNKTISLEEFYKLEKIFIDNGGGSLTDFHRLGRNSYD